MAIDPKNPVVAGGAAAVVLILLLLVWALMCSSRATKAEADLAMAKQAMSDATSQVADQKNLLEAAEALTDKRSKERDEVSTEVKDLRRQLAETQKSGKQNADLATDAEQKCQRAELAAQMAEEERAKVVKDRDHQYQQWRQTQDRYDDLLKTYNQLKQQVAESGGAKP